VSWQERADQVQRVLVDTFWDGRLGLFRATPRRRLPALQWHYWWQAHALDASVDAVTRAGATADVGRVRAHIAGILRRNGGRIANDYYDDMAWMALALLRADEVAGVDTAVLVAELWSELRGGWDPRHGGIVWRRGDTYTNTAANAPAAILAARLHRRHGRADDLEWAGRIAAWQQATLVDPPTGIVWDGIHPETDPRPSRELYTYNQGTVIGAEVELFRRTGEREHLDRARRTAAAALDRFSDPGTGLFPPEGAGDGGLFKGILARYLGELARADPEPHAPVTARTRAALSANGEAVSAADAAAVGADWTRPTEGERSLSTQLSAVLILEALAASEAASREGGGDVADGAPGTEG
jgi:predicted alpha-1,6-mannanase (GH76 family)